MKIIGKFDAWRGQIEWGQVWFNYPSDVKQALRNRDIPSHASAFLGFRGSLGERCHPREPHHPRKR
jgi:hypothetical protein